MKAEIFNIVASGIWVALIRYRPQIIKTYVWAFYPTLFLLSEIFIKYEINNYWVVAFSFVLIFVSAHLVRIFWPEGAGNQDQVGNGWDQMIFLLTTILTTIVLFITSYMRLNQSNIIQGIHFTTSQILLSMFYVLGLGIVTTVLFMVTTHWKE